MLVFFFFAVFPVATPTGGHDNDATPARFYLMLSIFSLLAFASVFPNKFFFICFSYVEICYSFASFSVARVSHDDGAKLSKERRISVVGGIQGNGEGGSGRRETAVDESRKETADGIARYQTDYVL